MRGDCSAWRLFCMGDFAFSLHETPIPCDCVVWATFFMWRLFHCVVHAIPIVWNPSPLSCGELYLKYWLYTALSTAWSLKFLCCWAWNTAACWRMLNVLKTGDALSMKAVHWSILERGRTAPRWTIWTLHSGSVVANCPHNNAVSLWLSSHRELKRPITGCKAPASRTSFFILVAEWTKFPITPIASFFEY